MTNEKPGYKTVVFGTLVQQSALSIGGTDTELSSTDQPFARDGQGRPTLTGSGMAGGLLETTARMFPDAFAVNTEDKMSQVVSLITGKRIGQTSTTQRELNYSSSIWQFQHAHPNRSLFDLRQGVGIRQATGATAIEQRALYDSEVLPRGTQWPFELEIDTWRGGIDSEVISFYSILEWMDGRCWLGANAARGCGWLKLDRVAVIRMPLTEESLNLWPDNSVCNQDKRRELANTLGEELAGDEIRKWLQKNNFGNEFLPKRRYHYAIIDVALDLNPIDTQESWGLESLSVGGHEAEFFVGDAKHVVSPSGQIREIFESEYLPDHPVATTYSDSSSNREAFIPGSGIRGPTRHSCSAILRGEGEEIPDPNKTLDKDSDGSDLVSDLFGIFEKSGCLLFSDAHLKDPAQLKMFHIHRHAEDEFTAGVWESSKFDRTSLVQGCFEFTLIVEVMGESNSPEGIHVKLKLLDHVADLARAGVCPAWWIQASWKWLVALAFQASDLGNRRFTWLRKEGHWQYQTFGAVCQLAIDKEHWQTK